MGRFDNKVVAVTGAGQGLGAVVAKKFVEEGATVLMIGRTLSKIENTAKEIGSDKAIPFLMDCGVESEWQRFVTYIKENYGEMDVLVNNAAILMSKDILKMTYEEFKENERVNLDGVFLGMKYCYEVLKKGGTSAIVNVSSTGGLKAGPNAGNDAGYNATKAGVRNLTKHAAYVFGKDGIRVNSVHPAGINTPMMQKHLDEHPELIERLKAIKSLPPYVAEKEDVTAAILFLADSAAKAITGVELPVDNGLMAM